MTNFNERTNTLLYKNIISHTLFSKGFMLVVCEGWAGDGDKLLYWASSTSFSSWLGCSTMGHWGPKALCLPLALTSASFLQLPQTVSRTWLCYCLARAYFRLFTQVHLLIDDSVKGQYITLEGESSFETHLFLSFLSSWKLIFRISQNNLKNWFWNAELILIISLKFNLTFFKS